MREFFLNFIIVFVQRVSKPKKTKKPKINFCILDKNYAFSSIFWRKIWKSGFKTGLKMVNNWPKIKNNRKKWLTFLLMYFSTLTLKLKSCFIRKFENYSCGLKKKNKKWPENTLNPNINSLLTWKSKKTIVYGLEKNKIR